MRKPHFYFLEPSKVGAQHIFVIEGYLTALASSQAIRKNWVLVPCASRSTLALLPTTITSAFRCRRVPVMNPEKRRLVLKSVLEFMVVLRRMVALRRGDILFVSCMLPPSLLMVEFANRLLRKTGVHVVLHGEIEGLVTPSRRDSFGSIGFWAYKWLHHRGANSRIQLVVIDDFIRENLLAAHPERLSVDAVSVVHLPAVPSASDHLPKSGPPIACFIGYRTRDKNFDSFSRMATEEHDLKFVAIGGGKIEEIKTGEVTQLPDKDSYLIEIARCSVALFPYTAGYVCSISAAAMDALAAGVPIIALDRPCFRSLSAYFGAQMVTVCSSIEEMVSELRGRNLVGDRSAQLGRVERLAESKFGMESIRRSFERLAGVLALPGRP